MWNQRSTKMECRRLSVYLFIYLFSLQNLCSRRQKYDASKGQLQKKKKKLKEGGKIFTLYMMAEDDGE